MKVVSADTSYSMVEWTACSEAYTGAMQVSKVRLGCGSYMAADVYGDY
jgi:hypothetical protein